MSLELTSDEARALELGHTWGLISLSRITQMADGLISNQKELLSSEICELAVCSRDFQVKEILSKFFKKSEKSEKWKPVILLLTEYLQLDNLNVADRVSLFYSISNYADWEDPEPWLTFKVRCHELSDARRGVYGDAAEISKELFDILSVAVNGGNPLRAG